MRDTVRNALRIATIAWIGCVSASSVGETLPGNPAQTATPEASESEGTPAWLGVFVGDAIDGGMQLVAVVPGGPAQKAGLLPGDLLIRLDGKPVPDRVAVNVLVNRIRPGNRVAAEILRQGRPEVRWLEAGPRVGPAWSQLVPGAAAAESHGDLGMALDAKIVAIPDRLRVHYGAPADRGALVASIGEAGAGAAAGLRVGDVIVAVDGTPVRDPGDSRPAAVGVPHRIELVRGGERRALVLPMPNPSAARAAPGALERSAQSGDLLSLRADIDRLVARVRELERQLELERSRRTK